MEGANGRLCQRWSAWSMSDSHRQGRYRPMIKKEVTARYLRLAVTQEPMTIAEDPFHYQGPDCGSGAAGAGLSCAGASCGSAFAGGDILLSCAAGFSGT